MYKTRTGDDHVALELLSRLKRAGYHNLYAVRTENVLRVEGLKDPDFAKLQPLFAHSVIEEAGYESFFCGTDAVVEVSYQRGVTDPELDSIRHAVACLGLESFTWARVATRYQLSGVDSCVATEIAAKYLFNGQVQTLLTNEWSTLVPQGQVGGVEVFDVGSMTLHQLRELSDARRLFLSDAQLQAIKDFSLLAKCTARDAEIEMVAAAYGDHCGHSTWRTLALLASLKAATRTIKHPLVLSAFDDNSGVIAFYEGWAINIKGETHISPTFGGSPYGGVGTKCGGVIRDIIFTGQGAHPIAGTTIMGTCDPRIQWEQVPRGAFHPQVVLKESIRGALEYCNPMGIPMAWSQYLSHSRNWKGLALGHSVGILPARRAQKGEPLGGDIVLLIGGKTGIDGIHGATVSSGSMTSETSTRDAAHVQIGMPIEQRKFMEAVPVLRDNDCIRACTDCGAAGLSSAVGEMGSSCGVWVNLAWVPLKCANMKPWEIWLSESQERGVLAVPPEKLELALNILESYDVGASVIGVFTWSARCQVVLDEQLSKAAWLKDSPESACSFDNVVVDLPYSFLNDGSPLPQITVATPMDKQESGFKVPVPTDGAGWIDLVQRVLGHYNICDQSAAAHQYDQTVQGATVLTYVSGPDERMPDELFVSAPILGKPYGVGIANSVNQFYGDVDPATFGRLMLASAAAKLVAAGFSPSDITLCANVYSPPVLEDSEHAWRLVQLVRFGYAPGTVEIGMPVISGKDSSSGRFRNTETGENIDAPLTLDILAVGRIPDVRKLIRKPFRSPGDRMYLFMPGVKAAHLGGSILYDLFGERGDKLPSVDLVALRKGFEVYHAAEQKIQSRSAVAEGGLIRRLFECCYGSGLGCELTPTTTNPLALLFAEVHGAILFTVAAEDADTELCSQSLFLGTVIQTPVIQVFHYGECLFSASMAELGQQWSTAFAEVIA